MDTEFIHHALPVLFDGLDADRKILGDLFVGLAFGNQLEHLHFARTEPGDLVLARWAANRSVWRVRILEAAGNRRTEKGLASGHFPNRFGENIGGSLLDQESGR